MKLLNHYSWKLALVAFVCIWAMMDPPFHMNPFSFFQIKTTVESPRIKVFTAFSTSGVARKKNQDLAASALVDHSIFKREDQKRFIKTNACADLQRYETFIEGGLDHLAQEMWKYCVLYVHGGMYIDAESPLLVSIDDIVKKGPNLAVLTNDHFKNTIHGSLLAFQEPNSPIAREMLDFMSSTPIKNLASSPMLIPSKLFNLLGKPQNAGKFNDWWIFELQCTVSPQVPAHRLLHNCPLHTGYCCQVFETESSGTVLMTKNPLLPFQKIPTENLPLPYNTKFEAYRKENIPFIATIHEKVNEKPENPVPTPNLFETLLKNNCLPADLKCNVCLRNKNGSDCDKCKELCPCYCKTLCNVSVDKKFVSKELLVHPPMYARDPSRLVPRIIHQTWFEDVTKEKYPNMSRLMESFKQSGWEYRFYSDEQAQLFLSTHFPSEVREAYDALRPGAFKADLFRYCVLLINGGVYADMDVLLESNLDLAIPPNVGFMIPVDEPGIKVDKRMCLWNGFIAAAPAHPFLARVIETVVNNVRNRFTSVDVDALFCPNPELSVLHAFDTLFTAGPCILGATVNKVLGRHGQTQFEPGAVSREHIPVGSGFQKGKEKEPPLPGRTIILKQDKFDMGAHRFTFEEMNIVVAATDMPEYDDREKLEDSEKKEHYSETHVKTGIYGLEKLYSNNKKANEDIKFHF